MDQAKAIDNKDENTGINIPAEISRREDRLKVIKVVIDADSDAGVNLVLNNVSTNDIADGSAIYVMAGTKLDVKYSF